MIRTALLACALLIASTSCAWADAPATAPSDPTVQAPGDGGLFSQATAEAKQKMAAAEALVTKALEKSPDYLAAKLEVANQTNKLEEAKQSGEIQDRINAVSNLTVARKKLAALLKEKLEQNADYVEAKKQYDSLAAISKVQDGTPDTTGAGGGGANGGHDQATADNIRDAIVHHAFVIGMTFQECVRSARATPQLVDSIDANTKSYRWIVQGAIGTHYVTERTVLGGTRTYPVTDYGVVGYVHATFVDGKLTTFDRRNRSDQ